MHILLHLMVIIPVILLRAYQEDEEVPHTIFGRKTVRYRTVRPSSFEIYGTRDGLAGTVKTPSIYTADTVYSYGPAAR
jgi:hypothetical protein